MGDNGIWIFFFGENIIGVICVEGGGYKGFNSYLYGFNN